MGGGPWLTDWRIRSLWKAGRVAKRLPSGGSEGAAPNWARVARLSLTLSQGLRLERLRPLAHHAQHVGYSKRHLVELVT